MYTLKKNIQKALGLVLFSWCTALPLSAQNTSACKIEKIEVERLPDMNIPRSAHNAFYLNGEVVVMGGHTTGFVPTPTAEYYRDGKWNEMPMTYIHDFAFALPLKSGKVLVAGGVSEALGIGQTFAVELYDPQQHFFDGFGCMDKKRACLSGTETDSGRVVIAGNWYGDDGIEMFDGRQGFSLVKPATQQRSRPYILRTSPNNVIIFSSSDTFDHPIDSIMADQLNGDPIHIPLFDTWHPVKYEFMNSDCFFIGDESKGDYSYLLLAQNEQGQIAFVRSSATGFSLLPTTCPIPTKIDGDSIYYGPVVVDRLRKKGYVGASGTHQVFILCIDYSRQPAQLTILRNDQLQPSFYLNLLVLPDGNIILTGGCPAGDNYHPYASVFLLHTGDSPELGKGTPAWPWLLALVGTAAAALLLYLFYSIRARRKRHTETAISEQDHDDSPSEEPADNPPADSALMKNICQLMEEEKLYRDSTLKIEDVARLLNSNRRYISTCINNERHCTFTQFVNTYRVAYAKQLLSEHPDKKLIEVGTEAGFANETSFYRVFKAFTGTTPREWMKK